MDNNNNGQHSQTGCKVTAARYWVWRNEEATKNKERTEMKKKMGEGEWCREGVNVQWMEKQHPQVVVQ